jgi:2'-5' RNA ligase
MIFPEFKNMDTIHSLRALYDPLANLVQPHITLVFPFESDITTKQLVDHLNDSLQDIKKFNITLQGISPHQVGGNYLFLNVLDGNDIIRLLHDKLYTGILKLFHRTDIPYVPHMTIGNIEEDSKYEEAIQNTKHIDELFCTQVTKISIETIGDSGESIIEYEYILLD